MVIFKEKENIKKDVEFGEMWLTLKGNGGWLLFLKKGKQYY